MPLVPFLFQIYMQTQLPYRSKTMIQGIASIPFKENSHKKSHQMLTGDWKLLLDRVFCGL